MTFSRPARFLQPTQCYEGRVLQELISINSTKKSARCCRLTPSSTPERISNRLGDLLHELVANRLENKPGHERGNGIHGARHDEDAGPAAGRRRQNIAKGHQQRCRSLRRVKHPRVRRRVLGTKGIGRGGGKQAVDLAPGEKHQPCEQNEGDRVASENAQRSEEHTSELQSHSDLVCRLLLEKKKT